MNDYSVVNSEVLTIYNMGEPRTYYTEWNNEDIKVQAVCNSIPMKYPEQKNLYNVD